MFPNVRLLIGTLFIALLVLSCEFGVFAALRVNREPLSRLTSESASLQLVVGKNAPAAVPVSWSIPRAAQAAAGGTQTDAAGSGAAAAQPAERAIDVPAPPNDDAAGMRNNDHQPSPAAVQTALAPAAAPPVPAVAPAADAAAPMAQAPLPPPPANSPAPANDAAPASPDASGAAAQEAPAPAVSNTAVNAAPHQPAAAPVALAAVPALAAAPTLQTPAADLVKLPEAQPPQAAPVPQANDTAAPASGAPASGTPIIAAVARAAAEPVAAQPAEITGSVPKAVVPEATEPKTAAPQAKPVSKIVHKPAAKKPHKTAYAPVQPHHAAKKRIVRRARAPAVASSAQTTNNFQNPVFQSAPQFQQPTRGRARAKNTATNNGFSNTFGSQFSTQ